MEDGSDQEADDDGAEAGLPVGADDPDEQVEREQDRDRGGDLAAAAGGEGAGHQPGPRQPAGQGLLARGGPGPPLGLAGAGGGLDRRLPLALARAALLRTLLAHRRAHRVRTQLRSRAAPASPDFSGWNWVRRQRAVLDGGDEPVAAVLGPGHQGRPGDGRASPAPSAGRRRSARSRTAPPRRRRRARSRARRPRRCSSPCAARPAPGAARPRRATRRSPRSRRRARPRARRAPACPRRCRAPAGRRRAGVR